jgi:hypothetical protein
MTLNNFDLLRLLAALRVAVVHGILWVRLAASAAATLAIGVSRVGPVAPPDWLPWWAA